MLITSGSYRIKGKFSILYNSVIIIIFPQQQWTTSGLVPHNNPISHLQELVVKNGMRRPEFE